MYGAGFVQVSVVPSQRVVESNFPVWSSCWNHGLWWFTRLDCTMSGQYGRTNAIWHKKTKRIIYRYTVENWQIDSSVCFWISCENISELYLYLCIHRSNDCMVFWFFFRMFASFAVTWGAHKVAFACCVRRSCKIPRRKCTCICWGFACIWVVFWFKPGAWVKYCSAQHLWKRGPNRWSERQIGRQKSSPTGKSCSDRHMNVRDNQLS